MEETKQKTTKIYKGIIIVLAIGIVIIGALFAVKTFSTAGLEQSAALAASEGGKEVVMGSDGSAVEVRTNEKDGQSMAEVDQNDPTEDGESK